MTVHSTLHVTETIYSALNRKDEHIIYFWFKYDLGQKHYAPQVRPDRGSNPWPPDHDSTFHIPCHWDNIFSRKSNTVWVWKTNLTSNLTVNDEGLCITYLDVPNNFPQLIPQLIPQIPQLISTNNFPQLIHHSKSPWFIRKPFILNTSHTASEIHKTKPWQCWMT